MGWLSWRQLQPHQRSKATRPISRWAGERSRPRWNGEWKYLDLAIASISHDSVVKEMKPVTGSYMYVAGGQANRAGQGGMGNGNICIGFGYSISHDRPYQRKR
jgi:hypothetical protein